jgi:hypothetical protein
VPAGSTVLGNSIDWQCAPMTYWPDGSLKHAIVAGRTSVTTGQDASITLSVGAPPGGTALQESNLTAALPMTTITVGGDVTTLNSLIGTAALHTTVCTGPVMSSWVYRRPVAGNAHLVVYVEVRLFKGGAVELFPWIENGYLLVANPTNFVNTCTVTINGSQRFSQSIDIKHHTRVPLINGSNFSYWVGTDPGITPKHDRTYLMATKLVPNFSWFNPSGATLDAAVQSYTPNTLAGDDNATGSTGGSGSIVSPMAVRYITSGGDVRAYKTMMAHALSSGSWSMHYRDESTQLPIAYATYPGIRPGWEYSAPLTPTPSGAQNTGGPAATHTPSYAYLPFMVTGRWWFLEEMHFWSTFFYMNVNVDYRSFASAIIDTASGYTVRGAAWVMNCTAQAAALTPTSHPLQAQFVASWQNTMANMYGKYVLGSGTSYGATYVSPLGVCGTYCATGNSFDLGWGPGDTQEHLYWWEAAYQHNYVAEVLGYSSDIGIPQSAPSLANHIAVRNHSYKFVIGRTGDGLGGNYNWRRFICYGVPFGSDGTGLPVDSYFSTFAQVYAVHVAGFGLATIPATEGLSLKQHSSDLDLTAGVSSLNYGGTALAALAMAVEHNQPGAQAGWDRITGASNYASSFAAFFTNEAPNDGVQPRVR